MFEVYVILGLLLLNGLFAMCEIALVSSSKSRLSQQADKGVKGAKIALELLREPEKFLSTVQIGITLVGILAGAFGAEAFTEDVRPFIEKIPLLSPYAGKIAFGLIITVLTYLSLIIGELVPKTIALNQPEKITVFFSPFMKGLAVVTYPLVAFLSVSTKVLLKVLRVKQNKNPPVTEEELKYMIQTGLIHGVIEKGESDLLYGVFNFGDRIAKSIMTLRKDIVWINIKQSRQKTLELVLQHSYTKYPVCEDSLDRIIGVISVSDILKYSETKKFDLRDHLIEPLFYSWVTPLHKILEDFRAKKVHIGFVVDEYGATKGLVTLHDLIENIVGDIPEKKEVQEKPVVERADGSLLINGEMRIRDVSKLLHIELPKTARYSTLAGFIIYQIAARPEVGSSFIFRGHKFEVVDMDGNKIDKVMVSKLKE